MSTVVSAKKSSIPKRRERRKERRQIVYARFPVLVAFTDINGRMQEPVPAMLTDISPKGLGLIANVQLHKGVQVTLTLSAGTPNEVQLVAKAAWASPLPTSGLVLKQGAKAPEPSSFWRVGLSIGAENKDQIALIDKLMKQL